MKVKEIKLLRLIMIVVATTIVTSQIVEFLQNTIGSIITFIGALILIYYAWRKGWFKES